MIKMRTKEGKWIVVDKGRKIIFDSSKDAWIYISIMRDVEDKPPQVPKSLYPVKTLNPFPTRRCKKVVLQNG